MEVIYEKDFDVIRRIEAAVKSAAQQKKPIRWLVLEHNEFDAFRKIMKQRKRFFPEEQEDNISYCNSETGKYQGVEIRRAENGEV